MDQHGCEAKQSKVFCSSRRAYSQSKSSLNYKIVNCAICAAGAALP